MTRSEAAKLIRDEAAFYEEQGLSPDYEHAQELFAAAALLDAPADPLVACAHPTREATLTESIDGDYWTCGACNEDMVLVEGTPEENHYGYCPFCGAKITSCVHYEEPPDDEDDAARSTGGT